MPNIPGFLTVTGLVPKDTVWPWLVAVYDYAWFVGFFISAISYLLMMSRQKQPVQQERSQPQGEFQVSSI
ncbi:hypothetical protein [Hymenobacter radiodurans]|uniref:hypothetical protein n=1 Tax=Hymenobacter radiodurans TaxID=2496028 RepID=UPI001F0DBCAF|nr:hypothetical protein [Hymenobacter radiodurans]